jgi:cytoskeleton protein RodZ
MNVATVGPGARLKLERERRGLSLQKAADEMRLDPWVIEALEAEQYERVGPAVYGKGHLKKYASILGISWDDIASGYELRASPPEAPPPPTSMRVPTAVPRVDRLPRAQLVAIGLLLLVIAGVLWWKPWQPRVNPVAANVPASAAADLPASETARSAESTPTTGALPDASPGAQGMPDVSPAANDGAGVDNAAAANKAAPATAADSIPGHGSASLRLSFSAESWVDVHDANGKRIYSGYGHANSVKTIAGEGPLRIYLGYASGVQVEINDHAVAIGTQFLHGDVARFQAGADGILRSFTANERPRG